MNYQTVLEEIEAHALKCGRDLSEITLLAVSKGYQLEHVIKAYNVGCRDFGENRVQEALPKISVAPKEIRWHLIGSLQKNKVNKVVGHFHLIHSVDDVDLARKISERSQELKIKTSVLLQVNPSGEESKHGFSKEELLSEVEELRALKGIEIRGLMTMAPFVEDEAVIRACFRGAKELRDQTELGIELSMGMSHDWPIAVEEGATILRIGTAIFKE